MKVRLLIATIAVILFLIWMLYSITAQVKRINEPDVRTFSKSQLAKRVSSDSASFQADQVLYVNSDFNGYIFVGKLTDGCVAKTTRNIAVGTLQDIPEACWESDGYTEIRWAKRAGKVIWGVVRYQSLEEWLQAEDVFNGKWDEALRSVERSANKPR